MKFNLNNDPAHQCWALSAEKYVSEAICKVKYYLDQQGQVLKSKVSGVLTEVWHMAHFWVSYGRCTMPGSPMGRSEGSSRRWTG